MKQRSKGYSESTVIGTTILRKERQLKEAKKQRVQLLVLPFKEKSDS